ncbi:MAG: cation:proton antiporter [Chloroflexota bacterium]
MTSLRRAGTILANTGRERALIEAGVGVSIVLVLVAAVVGAVLALLLRQPVIVGYLLAGVIVGPFTPGPRADFDQLRLFTEIGVALLLFTLGAGMPFSSFRGMGRVVVLGGILQVALTIALGMAFVPWFGLSLAQGILLGTILAQSSSAVIAKILHDRHETGSTHGRIAIGLSLIQDISSFPLLLILLVFLGEGTQTVPSFFIALAEVFGLAIATYLLGRILWPRVLGWVGRFRSGELMLLTTLALALIGSLAMEAIGLSFALGAFLAGLVVAESGERPEALSRLLPLKDVLAAFFFVSIGTLFNPSVLWEHALPLLGLLAVLIVGKGVVSALSVRLFGPSVDVAVLAGLLLAQIGEFAFILANIGLSRGAIPESLFSLVIGSAVISIMVNSLVLDSAPGVLAYLARVTRFEPLMKQPGRAMARILRSRGKRGKDRKTTPRP